MEVRGEVEEQRAQLRKNNDRESTFVYHTGDRRPTANAVLLAALDPRGSHVRASGNKVSERCSGTPEQNQETHKQRW